MGYLTSGWRTCTADLEHQWTTSCTRLFLEWGRACWTHHNNTLHGPCKNRHQQRRQKSQAEARVWLKAPSTEALVPLHKVTRLKRDITRATAETLATWLLNKQTMRRLIRNENQPRIIMRSQTKASLEVSDKNFHRKLTAAR